VDGSGQPNAYGAFPPAQAVTILGGPFMDHSDQDRPRYDQTGHQLCNESVNGSGFGDNIANNERYGLTGYMTFGFQSGLLPFDPKVASEYYNCMKSIWSDSTHLVYGGNGQASGGEYGPACRFMFPGASDTLNWGTGCLLPNGPVYWTASTAGISPEDFHCAASMGPFTFHPGDVQQLDYAFIFARDYTGHDSLPSVNKLRQMIDIVRNSYTTGKLPDGNSFFGINEHSFTSQISVKIYPDPASNKLTVSFDRFVNEKVIIWLVQTNGLTEYSTEVMPYTKEVHIDVGRLTQGVYILIIQNSDFTIARKVVVIH
jgi:hypothetical protein